MSQKQAKTMFLRQSSHINRHPGRVKTCSKADGPGGLGGLSPALPANEDFPDARQQIRVFPVQPLSDSFSFALPADGGAVTATHVAFSPDGERLMVLAERDGGYLYGLFPTDQL